MDINHKLVETKIYEKWVPKLEAHLKEKGTLDRVSKDKMKKMAKMCHARKIYESVGFASPYSVPGNGAFAFGNNPATPGDYTKGSGDVFQSLWSLFIDVAASTFGMDLMPILTMTKSHLNVFISEPIYTDGKIASASAPPTVFMVKGTKTGAFTSLVVGTTYIVKTAFALGENVIDLTFVGFDRVKGYYVFKTGQQYDNTGGGGTNWKLSNIAACVSGTNHIYQTAIIFLDLDQATVDYVSGYNNFISGYAGAGATDTGNWYMNRSNGSTPHNTPMNRETGESTFSRSIGLRKWNKNFEAQKFFSDVEYTNDQIQDYKMDHDVDAVELGRAALQDLLSQHINEHMLGEIYEHGWQHHYNMNQINGFNANAFLGTTTGSSKTYYGVDGVSLAIGGPTGSLPASGAISENLSSIQRRIITRISYGSGVVKARSRRGKGDTMITNTTFVSAIKDIRGYTPAVFENDINDNGLDLAGNFNGIQVYEDGLADFSEERIAIFRKGKENDPGLKMATYLLAERFQTVAEQTMAPKEMLQSRFVIARTGSAPELNYLTINVEQDAGYKIV